MIGIHYDSNIAGVISMEDSTQGLSAGITLADISDTMTADKYDAELSVGTELTKAASGTLRLPAIRCYIKGE